MNSWIFSSPKMLVRLMATIAACSVLSPGAFASYTPHGPLLADRANWDQPMYYRTIRAVDIDGDGNSDIVARAADGLHAWRAVQGAWIETLRLNQLSDAAGWTDPSWYGTIRGARLRADSAQADILARSSDGVHVWRYNPQSESWLELGATQVARPFADQASNTDWTKPQYYTSLLTGDIDGDGQDELIGRSKNGLAAYHWNEAEQRWDELERSGPLSDEEGFAKASDYLTLQLANLQGTGNVLMARAADGVEVLTWRDNHWIVIASGGPFADGACAPAGASRSVQTFTDQAGRSWLFGVTGGSRNGDAAILLYRWQSADHSWVEPTLIPLPGHGWHDEAQYLTLRAIDFEGDGKFALTARSSHGLLVFRRRGHVWQPGELVKELGDASGFGLPSAYKTIQTVFTSEGGKRTSALLVRGPEGIEVYHSVHGQLTQQTPFPNWQNANQVAAYQVLSYLIGNGYDVRSTYAGADNDYTYWSSAETTIKQQVGKQPANIPAADWEAVRQQLQTEFSYVAAARAWFQNNATLTRYVFAAAALQLTTARNYENISSSAGGNASVDLNWGALALGVVNGILSALGQPELTLVTGLLESAIEGAASATSGGNNNIQAQVAQIANQIGQVNLAYTTTNAQQMTSYVTDWGLLQNIGIGSTGPNPKYQWGQGTSTEELANAEILGANGQALWMFQELSAAAWHVWWCYPSDPKWTFGGCLAFAPPYETQYIIGPYIGGNGGPQIDFTAYVVLQGNSAYPDFDAFDLLKNQYGVNYNDLLSNCANWNLNTPAPSSLTKPNSCKTTGPLSTGAANNAAVAIASLRDLVASQSPDALTASLDAATRYIQKHATWQPDPNGGAPSASDVAHALADGIMPQVDSTTPLQYIRHFIRTVAEEKKRGLDPGLSDIYNRRAYSLIGLLGEPSY
jgi:hypothetical protein